MDDRMAFGVEPGAGKGETGARAGTHALNAAIPGHHGVEIGGAQIDVVEAFQGHGHGFPSGKAGKSVR
jgi:hypothetical protein